MFPKKPILIFLIGFLILIIVIFGYTFLKLMYYEDTVLQRIKAYNEAIVIYNNKLKTLDSSQQKNLNKYNFVNISEDEIYSDQFGTDYKGYIKWLENKIHNLANLNKEMEIKKFVNETLKSINVEEEMEGSLTIHDTTVNKDLLYTTDEIQGIYDDKRNSKNEKKKAKK